MIIDYPAYTKESFIKSLVHFYGSSIADAPMTKSDDDLYLVSLNYCSHYDDDDCGFTYINAKTGETVSAFVSLSTTLVSTAFVCLTLILMLDRRFLTEWK